MNNHESIERQEREFTDLLQRVMQAPLSPLAASVQKLEDRMDQLEERVIEMRDIELAALNLGVEDTRKEIRSLKTRTEETPQEVRDMLQPLFEQLQVHFEQGTQQRIHQMTTDLMGQLAHTEQQAASLMAGLQDAIVASQGAVEASQKQGFEHLENFQQTTLAQVHTECENLRGEVGNQLAEQSADGQRTVKRVQEMLSLHRQELKQQSTSGFRQLGEEADARMSQLTQSMTQLQTALGVQQQQLECLQQQQTACSERQGEQMQHAFLALRKWVIASVCVAASSLAGVVALAAGKI